MEEVTTGFRFIGVLVGTFLAFTPPATAGTFGASTPYPAALGFGAWCWFASPQAIRVGDQTITGYVDTSGDIVADSLVEGRLVHSYVLHTDLQVDDHDTPTFWQRPDGRIVAFYSKHAVGNILYRITINPGDITSWGPEYAVPDPGVYGATYPNPLYISSEHRLYLYFRGGTWHPTMTYSDDWGLTWAPTQELVNPETTPGPDDAGHSTDRPYARYAERFGRTYIAFTNAHPDSRPTNIYAMTRRGGVWYSVSGQPLTTPVVPGPSTLVFNAVRRGLRAWVWDVEVDATGHPVIVFVTMPFPHLGSYWYARWTGYRWFIRRLIGQLGGAMSQTNGLYAAGIAIDPQDTNILAVARMGHPIALWLTVDGGRTWTSCPLPGTRDGVRPIFVYGDVDTASPEVLYMEGTYPSYATFRTQIFDLRASSTSPRSGTKHEPR